MTNQDPQQVEPGAPRQDESASSVADGANHATRFDALRRLREIGADANAAGDVELASAARVEHNVLMIFEDDSSLSRFGADLRQHVFVTDVDYLRGRAQATPNLRAKARYLHAVTALTNRHDDANAAVDALLDALRDARTIQGSRGDIAEAFDALRDLYPMVFRLSRRARALRRVLDEAIEFIASENEAFVHAKTHLFRSIMADVRLEDGDARRLRDPSLAILFGARGGDHGEIIATGEAGRRLADRLGEAHAPWLEAEARALEARLEYNQHPMLAQMVGTRLLRIYQLLGDESRMSATIERNRSAAANMEYETFYVHG